MEKAARESERPKIEVITEGPDAWEKDGGAWYKLSRRDLSCVDGSKAEELSMLIAGYPSERLRVIDEFTELFDYPRCHKLNLNDPNHIDNIIWTVVDQSPSAM